MQNRIYNGDFLFIYFILSMSHYTSCVKTKCAAICGCHYKKTRCQGYNPTNQKNWPSVGTIESTLAQYSAIYGNTLGQFSWFVGKCLKFCQYSVSQVKKAPSIENLKIIFLLIQIFIDKYKKSSTSVAIQLRS